MLLDLGRRGAYCGQHRAASKAGSVMTSTRVCPSGVWVTAVPAARGSHRTVAAAQPAAQAGAGRAGPASRYRRSVAVPLGIPFLRRDETPGNRFRLPDTVIHRRICGYVDRPRLIPRPGARGMGCPARNRAADLLGASEGGGWGNGRENGGSGKRACDSPAAPPGTPEGAAPRPVTDGSQDRGGGQGAVATAGGIRTGRTQGPDGRHPG